MRKLLKSAIVAGIFGLWVSHSTIAEHEQIEHAASEAYLVIGGAGSNCLADSDCINRFHPNIPMKRMAQQRQTLIFKTRDALDVLGTVDQQRDAGQDLDSERFMTLRSTFGTAHPMAGPVHIAGGDIGDTLKVTILEINAGQYGYTFAGRSGFMSDLVEGGFVAVWKLTDRFATSADIPGIQIPNGSFPGIVATLPGKSDLEAILTREQQLHDAGGTVFLPYPEDASPVALCGIDGGAANACLRTMPPREQGGNMDIRHLGEGVTVYLPCKVAGCGLMIGDLHYAQGDGEVSGTAIEMSADVTVTTEVIKGYSDLRTGPHYEGDASVLQIPSKRFYAVTGLPLKTPGASYPNLHYLDSDVVGDLSNLSNDISLAARNALDGMIDHIVATYGYSRNQTYVIASVAVDLRITQLVDAPNVGVTAILPLDIFVEAPH